MSANDPKRDSAGESCCGARNVGSDEPTVHRGFNNDGNGHSDSDGDSHSDGDGSNGDDDNMPKLAQTRRITRLVPRQMK